MSRPDGIVRKTKDNRNKHPHIKEAWTRKKREGRAKQVWVNGRWEKTE